MYRSSNFIFGLPTEDGSVKALSQILYGHYYLWVICFRPEDQSFLQEKEPDTFFYGQGTHSAKIVLIVWPKIPQMPQKISAQFVCPSPKVCLEILTIFKVFTKTTRCTVHFKLFRPFALEVLWLTNLPKYAEDPDCKSSVHQRLQYAYFLLSQYVVLPQYVFDKCLSLSKKAFSFYEGQSLQAKNQSTL